MMTLRLIALLLAFVMLAVSVTPRASIDDAGTCTKFGGDPEDCERYAPKDPDLTFVPGNESLPSMVSKITDQLGKLDSDTITCVSESKRFLCANVFHPCKVLVVSGGGENATVSVPRALCKSYCQSFVDDCASQLQQVGLGGEVPDCSNDDLYPEKETSYSYLGQTFAVECFVPEEGPDCLIDLDFIQLFCPASALSWTMATLF